MNPFRDAVVRDPWDQPQGDVRAIHQGAFERCLAGLQFVRQNQRTGSILIHGPAGGGKTHLLRRLRAHLSLKMPSATDREEALFVWVRLQTTPRMIWRTLRRTLVNDWFRPLAGQRSQFDRILYHQQARIRVAEGDLEPWHDYMLDEDPTGLESLMERIAESLDLDRNTAVALKHLAFRRHRRDLRAWLAGDALPEAALERMDLAQEDGTDEELEEVAQRAVLMLCRLAGNDLPIVLSFDQVEALETSHRDREALYSFGQLISTLHDSTHNVLIISAVQSSFADRLLQESREADRDRMASLDTLTLQALRREEGAALIRVRLEGDLQGVPDVRPTEWWPLSNTDVTELFDKSTVTPRKLLARCADRFEAIQATQRSRAAEVSAEPAEAVCDVQTTVASQQAAPIPQYLAEIWEKTRTQKLESNQPQQTEEIIRSTLPVLASLTTPETKVVIDEQLPDVSLILQNPSGKVGVSVCTQPNMTSLSARLKRLKAQHQSGRLNRLVVVRDSRVPLTPTAKQARAHLQELEQKGAVVLHPAVEVLAALDALRGLLADAHSGDLACQGETIGPRTLEEWLVQHLADELREFVESVLGTEESASIPNSRILEELTTLLAQQPMLPLERTAKQLGISSQDLAVIVRNHPHLFGLIEKPEMLVFRAAAG